MDIGTICEVVSTELGIGEVREAGLAKIDIEKVREDALIYYGGLEDDEKKAAEDFFEAMDTNESKTISIDEFRIFLSHAKIQTDDCDWLFKELDKDKNNTLDFEELFTFFYILSRDEYKHLFYRSSTDIPGRKEESNHPKTSSKEMAGAKGQEESNQLKTGSQKVAGAKGLEESNQPKTGSQKVTGAKGLEESNHPKIGSQRVAGAKGQEESNQLKTGSQKVAEAEGLGQKWDLGRLLGLFGKLKRAYKVVEWGERMLQRLG